MGRELGLAFLVHGFESEMAGALYVVGVLTYILYSDIHRDEQRIFRGLGGTGGRNGFSDSLAPSCYHICRTSNTFLGVVESRFFHRP